MRVTNQEGLTTGSRTLMPTGGDGSQGEEQSLTSIWQTIVKRKIDHCVFDVGHLLRGSCAYDAHEAGVRKRRASAN